MSNIFSFSEHRDTETRRPKSALRSLKDISGSLLSGGLGWVLVLLCLIGCSNKKSSSVGSESVQPVGPTFCADSAYAFCEAQCAFGPRTMNSAAHDSCGQWIAGKFRGYGLEVVEQNFTVKGYDGTPLRCKNIIASYRPEQTTRILVCAHWDSRPWADNDPDEANWRKPVMAANDGASGIAVMIELARLIAGGDSLALGVDFICFDAEDWGTPQWVESTGDDSDTWALGSQHWAANPHRQGYEARYGILLDMVGGSDARFHKELVSKHFAPAIVDKVWAAASAIGYGNIFPATDGGGVNDDHVPVNRIAGIPTIDIIPHYPDCEASSFGPTWHTVSDDMDHIDRGTLQAVGQTVIQVLFSEK